MDVIAAHALQARLVETTTDVERVDGELPVADVDLAMFHHIIGDMAPHLKGWFRCVGDGSEVNGHGH